MKPVWLETWTAEDAEQEPQEFYMRFARIITGGEAMLVDAQNETAAARVRLAAAAPAMVRALLSIEWGDYGDRLEHFCAECGGVARFCGGPRQHDPGVHQEGCALDAALKAAGFPDQASRDAAREMIRKGGEA